MRVRERELRNRVNREEQSVASDAVVVAAGDGERVTYSERRSLTIKYTTAEMVVLEHDLETEEDGPPIHFHEQHMDAFYILEGELVFTIDGEEVTAQPGSFVAIPPGVVHTFLRAKSDKARFVNIHAPGFGFDEYMRQDAAAAARGASESERKALAEQFDEFQP